MMIRKTLIAGITVAAMLAGAPGIPAVRAAGNCDPGDRIDGSTAAQAKQKIEAAGYAQVHDLRKGCDNFWHGEAIKDGTESHVALSPAGQVLPEGD